MKKIILLTAFNVLGVLAFQAQINDSLVAHYLLDGNGNDAVGNNHGTVNGATLNVDRNGNLNSAYLFDGIDDWISIGSTPDLNITGDITVSAWVKTPISWPTVYHDPMIYARYSSPGTNGVNLWLDNPHLSSRAFGFIMKTGSNSWGDDMAISTSVLQLDTWYFVVGVREGSSVKIYLNGVLENTDIGSSNPINYGSNPIATIGEKGAAAPIWYDGVIDDVRIYKKALSATEIDTILVTSIENESITNEFSIYPNPVLDYLNIEINNISSIKEIKLANIRGQILKSIKYIGFRKKIKLDVKSLMKGIYFIQVSTEEGQVRTFKFLKATE